MTITRNALVFGLAFALLVCGGCSKEEVQSAADDLGKSTKELAGKAGDAAKDLADKAGDLTKEGKDKVINTLKAQLDDIDIDALRKKAGNADAATRAKVSGWIEALAGQKDVAKEAIQKLVSGDGVFADLLGKAKEAVGALVANADKIRQALGK